MNMHEGAFDFVNLAGLNIHCDGDVAFGQGNGLNFLLGFLSHGDVCMSRAIVKINKTDRKAAKILGSVIIPQHLVLKSALEAGSNHVLGIAGASIYSQIAIRPCKKPVKEAILYISI